MTQVNATYSVKSWNRKPWGDNPAAQVVGAHLARVEIRHVYEGGIEGEGIIQYLFADNGDGKGSFVALEKLTGSVDGRSGSFVFQHTGTFDNGWIKKAAIVVPGTGTGELSGLSGQVAFEGIQHQEHYLITFDYAI